MNRILLESINAAGHGRSLIARNNIERRLAQLGLRLHFVRLPDGWIPAVQPADLTQEWQQAGLPLSGVGYSTIGAVGQDGHSSSRFWPTSPFYQAWLGAYVLHAPGGFGWQAGGVPVLPDLLQAVLVDQRAWLRNYGCPAPQVDFKPASFHLVESGAHQDFPALQYTGVLQTQSDIGSGNRYPNGYILYRTYELMFQRFAGLKLPPLCTLPPIWPLPSYHPLELDMSCILIRLAGREQLVILYFCAAAHGDSDQAEEVKAAALAALRQVRIISN